MRLAQSAQNACDTLSFRLQQPEEKCTAEKGSGKKQPEGKCIAWCGNKCLHSGHNHQRQRTNGDATCTCRYMQATICGSEPLHKAVLIGVQILVLQRTCPQAAAFLIPFSQWNSEIALFL